MSLIARWRALPLVVKFGTTGGIVMLVATLVIGNWITGRIQQSVVDSNASAAALYVESFISPLSQELAGSDRLSEPAELALTEVFANTPIGDRIVSFKIWKPGGLVIYAFDPTIVGQRFEPTEELRRAWAGEVSGTFEDLDDPESAGEAALDLPLLEVYSPIREVWSGEVIAVAEFYEVATELEADLADARRTSWLVVAGVLVASGLMLTGIVRAGGRTIEQQRAMLEVQVADTRRIAEQNSALRLRAIGASGRATAETDRILRRTRADLHDGPAQYIALAAMRLDSLVPDTESGKAEAATIREAMRTALAEIRTISQGLSLPDLGGVPLADVVRRAVDAHLRPAGGAVPCAYCGPEDPPVEDSLRICVYRFLQEGLSNAARHAPEAQVKVVVEASAEAISAVVLDDGPGFEPGQRGSRKAEGGQGLAGLRDRAESLGGSLEIASGADGTKLSLTLPLGKGAEI
jgi:signal transduction histidine kinase